MSKIYDITQELFSSSVYPGDLEPSFERVQKISDGDACNLTNIKLCAHNGTHVDAPCHFVDGARAIDEVGLEKCVGEAHVVSLSGKISRKSLDKALPENCKRLLIKGDVDLDVGAAELLSEKGVVLVGVEAQSVGYAPVHIEILRNEIVILEGIVLDHVSEGKYFLFAAPLKLRGSDGAPCRAILMEI